MPYPEEMVAPMRAEAVAAGALELRTADAVRSALGVRGDTALFFVNSVCGCSASAARPGLAEALRGPKRPDRVFTSFAGNDVEAVAEIRAHLPGVPPSSPCLALFSDGKAVAFVGREHIQGATAEQLAARLTGIFAETCRRP